MILLVRHPRVEAEGRCYGRLDLPVADPEAVIELAGRIRSHPAWEGGAIYTSPAQRCRRVAETLGEHRVDDRLRELDFGAWEGMRWDDVPRTGLDAWAADPWRFAPPGGESGAALVARIHDFAAECEDGTVVISHGGPLKVLRFRQGDTIDLLSPAQPPGSVIAVDSPRQTLP